MIKELKLNLGCGTHPIEGYINVDKYGEPDIVVDLETFPWPWRDSTVNEIFLNHVLEHLGQKSEVHLNIMKEIYRVCKDDALVYINVPHPRHDDFINDPTHVRVITPGSLNLFSKKNNQVWIEGGFANSPLGIYLNVDFELQNVERVLDPYWQKKLDNHEISESDIHQFSRQYNNVIKEYRMIVRVIK